MEEEKRFFKLDVAEAMAFVLESRRRLEDCRVRFSMLRFCARVKGGAFSWIAGILLA